LASSALSTATLSLDRFHRLTTNHLVQDEDDDDYERDFPNRFNRGAAGYDPSAGEDTGTELVFPGGRNRGKNNQGQVSSDSG
jgi:hypothetical protein